MPEAGIKSFLKKKKAENNKRRDKINTICHKMNPVAKELMEFLIQDIFFSQRHMIAFCPVPKTASTTWIYFFLKTGKGG